MLDDELLGESSWRGPSGLKKKPFYRRTWFSALLALGILACAGLFGVFVIVVQPLREKAETFDLEDCKKLEAISIIYDRNGGELGPLGIMNRTPVKLTEVPAHFKKALMAQEDARFYEHHGVDWYGLSRAVFMTIKLRKVTQGASTITQQLAKQTFDLKEKSLNRKILEAFVAMRLEKHYSKEEIMELYLNRIYFGGDGFGRNFYGIQAAAQGYFAKDAKDLNIQESATICGLIKSPNRCSPLKHPQASIKARNQVIRRMLDETYLTKAEAADLETKALITPPPTPDPRLTYAYDWVRQEVIKLLGEERAATGGFRIYTSIDPALQAAADEAVRRRLGEVESLHKGWSHQTYDQYHAELEDYKRKLKAGSIDPTTPRPVSSYLQGSALVVNNADGSLLAVVGGRDFKDNQFNRAFQAKPPVGTAFTPILYAAAFSRPQVDLFPATRVDDNLISNRRLMIGGFDGLVGEWGQEKEPGSLPPYSQGKISLREVMTRGQNVGMVLLGEQVGLPTLTETAKNMGIDSPIKQFPASYLGASEAQLDEMCLAYSAFANKGIRPKKLHVVNRIADSTDKTIYQIDEQVSAPVQVMDEVAAWQVNSCLMDVMNHGTGSAARSDFGLKDFPVAGKTGTHYNFTDMWHIGYSTAVTCGVWVGFDRPTKLYENAFSNRIALPIWTDIMNATVKDYKPEAFTPPQNAEQVAICTKSGLRATDFCFDKVTDAEGHEKEVPTTYVELVRPGTRFEGFCTFHKGEGIRGLIDQYSLKMGQSGSPSAADVVTDPRMAHVQPVHMQSVTLLGMDHDPFHSTPPAPPVPKAIPVTEDGVAVRKAMPVSEAGDDSSSSSLPVKLLPPKATKIQP